MYSCICFQEHIHNFIFWSKTVFISEDSSLLVDNIGYLTLESIMTSTLALRLLQGLRSPQKDWKLKRLFDLIHDLGKCLQGML